MNVDKEVAQYRAWLISRGRESSANKYCRHVRRWLYEPEVYEDQIINKRYSPNYRRSLVASLRSWANYSEDVELLRWLSDLKLPAAAPKGSREPIPFKKWRQIQSLIRNATFLEDPEIYVCGIVAARGIRCGDVLRLTYRDIRDAVRTGVLRFQGKGERWQEYNAALFMPQLKGLKSLYWEGKERVWEHIGSTSSQESAGRRIRRAFDLIAEHAKLPTKELYAHRFRHTYATYFLQEMAGNPEAIFLLQQQMGWTQLNTASNYLRRSRRDELNELESRMFSRKR